MIVDTCKCGAEFRAAYTGLHAATDERFAHSEWLTAHASCRVAAQVQRLEHVANTLQRALDQLLNGTLLDEFNNHSDNGLPDLIDRCGDKYLREQLTRHLKVITAALAAKGE